eukprot:scaffold28839_cov79-Cyclotella_meneghiniana.AAC.1
MDIIPSPELDAGPACTACDDLQPLPSRLWRDWRRFFSIMSSASVITVHVMAPSAASFCSRTRININDERRLGA